MRIIVSLLNPEPSSSSFLKIQATILKDDDQAFQKMVFVVLFLVNRRNPETCSLFDGKFSFFK